jgi:hypothetical protein
MRFVVATAVVISLAATPQQRGAVTSVTAEADSTPNTFLFTVQGTRPCGAVNLDTGDGSSVTHAVLIPTTISYQYKRTGTFTVRASGQGNCDGLATTTVNVPANWPQGRGGSQRGAVTSVTAQPDPNPGLILFTVQGTRPCGAVNLDTGDGSSITHAVLIPTTIWYEYKRNGDFTVRARGEGNCDGLATTTVRVTTARPQPDAPPPSRGNPPATPTPTTPPPGRGRAAEPPPARGAQPRTAEPQFAMRFVEMDRNRDGVITRNEWMGSNQSFDTHDWNGDGRLAGDEVRVGATPPNRQGRWADQFNEWTEGRFRQLDVNRDNRLSRAEWRFNVEDFLRLDRNRDNVLSLNEFLVGDIDEDRGDRFDDLDVNRNNRIERAEWHGSLDTFRWLDRNGDGVLSRMEASGSDQSSGYPSDRGRSGNTGRTITVAVSSQLAWTDTGITLQAGDRIQIRATGQIQFSGNGRDVAEPDGARGRASTAAAPLPNIEIGALIGRIGNSAPFLIGSDSGDLRAPRDGRLYLGVNDDILRDNRGEFRVTIIR